MLHYTNFEPSSMAANDCWGRSAVPDLVALSRPCAVSLYGDNDIIYAQGDKAGPLYLVEFGTVRICHLTADGRRQISAFHLAGEVFGFESGEEHQSFAESIDSAGIRVLRAGMREGMDAHILRLVLQGMARTQDHLLLLGRLNANEKLASFLVDMARRQDADRSVDLPMQRSDIADYLGLTFETVSRVLRIFRDAGLISTPNPSVVEILDLRGLERASGQR